MVVYGGDEVSAVVLDIGSHTTRAGYAGEDTPKCIIPTAHGFIDSDLPPAERADASGSGSGGGKMRKFFVGEDGAGVWREGMEVGSMMADGVVADPTPLPSLLHHTLHTRLNLNPAEHPLLTTEPSWATPHSRQNMAELVFEQEGVPAWYVATQGVLSAFASGRGTALVVDVGHDLCSITPVYEGYVLRAGTRRQPLAMNLIHSQMKTYLQRPQQNGQPSPVSLTPHQLIKSRTPVPSLAAPKFTLRQDRLPGTTESWRNYAENKIVEGWRESCAAVVETSWDDRIVNQRPTRPHEFPDGYSAPYGSDRFRLTEPFFQLGFINPNSKIPPSLSSTPASDHSRPLSHMTSLVGLAVESVMACDLDVRAGLLANVVVVGGGSLVPGFVDRFNWEMAKCAPNQKLKIHAPGHTVERRYSAWLGGSILASLGTFHQLWISKEEYREHGPNIIAQRCK